MRKLLFLVILMLLFGTSAVFAGTTGKLQGKVRDKKSGDPIPGVTIRFIENNRIGGISHPDGSYVILNIPGGSYTVKATAVGYEPLERKGINISADATVEINLEMEEKTISGHDTLIVVANRNPLVDIGNAQTKSEFSDEQIRQIPRETVQGILTLNPGVTIDATNGGYSIRGGRSTETSVRVDNMDVDDPISGGMGTNATLYPSVPILGVQEVQVIKGGVNAEYGNELSGVVNTVTKEGRSDRYEGEIQYQTDAPFLDGVSNSPGLKALKLAPLGQNLVNFNVDGPVSGIDGLRFDVSGSGNAEQHRGEYIAINEADRLQLIDPAGNNVGFLPNDRLFQRSLSGNLVYDASPNVKLKLEAYDGVTYYELGRWSWLYANDMSLVNTAISNQPDYITQGGAVNLINQTVNFTIDHTLSSNTLYELGVGYVSVQQQIGKANTTESYSLFSWNGWDLYGFNNNLTGNSVPTPSGPVAIDPGTYDRYAAFYNNVTGAPVRNPITGHYEGAEDFTTTHNAYGVQNVFAATGNEGSLFENQTAAYYQTRGFIQSQADPHNLLKAGFQLDFNHDMKILDDQPWNAGAASAGLTDNYDYNPFDMAIYVQDQLQYSGVVFTPGLRWDYLAPNSYHLVNPENYQPYYAGSPYWSKTAAEGELSPRFGLAYPITDHSQFHISYGWFFQHASYDDLFSHLQVNPDAGVSNVIGNPNLVPGKTKTYEIGYDNQFSEDMSFTVTAYYKDEYNLVGTTQYSQVTTQGANGLAYAIYESNEYANQRGVEFTLRKSLTSNYSLVGNFTVSQSIGTSSSVTQSLSLSQGIPANPYNPSQSTTIYPASAFPMDYDRPIVANLVANATYRQGEGPEIGGVHFLENFNFNLTGNFESGTPYTRVNPKTGIIIGDFNGSRNPSWWDVDMRIERFVPLRDIFGDFMGANTMASIYFNITNIFNNAQALYYYAATGAADNNGVIITPGDFDATVWYKNGTGSSQTDLYGRPLYTTAADPAGKGYVDQQDKYNSYMAYVNDNYARRANYQLPREVSVGVTFKF